MEEQSEKHDKQKQRNNNKEKDKDVQRSNHACASRQRRDAL